MKAIRTKQALNLIANCDTFYGVTFIKKDKSTRYMLCRQGVSKGVNGRGMSWNAKTRGYVITWDVKKQAHRMINTQTITELRINKQSFKIIK